MAIAVAAAGSGAACGLHKLDAVELSEPVCEEPHPTLPVDEIRFGDLASEAAHAFVGTGTIVGVGAFGEPTRRIAVGAPLRFQMPGSPDAQNYLTVKLFGSDADPAVLFVFIDGMRIGAYGAEMPELDQNVGEASFPGGFVYVTYLLPRSMTDGKTTLALTLDAIGAVAPFAAPGDQERPLTEPTRPIYRAYLHTDPFFTPSADESQGTPLTAKAPAPVAQAQAVDGWHQASEVAVGTALGWQLYGDTWNAAATAGTVPREVLGFLGSGVTPTAFSTPQAWKDWAASVATAGNANQLNLVLAIALAYGRPWSQYYGDAEMPLRVVAALDSMELMQGSNGAFSNSTWVGAPVRLPATQGSAEGFGTRELARAFLLMQTPLQAAGLLEVAIDDDADATTPMVPRRQAWATMFAAHRDFMASPAAHTGDTNYDQANAMALWLDNEALTVLDATRAWPRAQALSYVETAVGLTAEAGGNFTVSPKGLPLEGGGTLGGGYDGRLGLLTIRTMCDLGMLTGDDAVNGRCLDAVHASAPFIFPSIDAGFRTMRSEAVIAVGFNRNPGYVEFGGSLYAAFALGDRVAGRAAQLSFADAVLPSLPPAGDAHFAAILAELLLDLPYLEMLPSLAVSGYLFPMEDAAPDFAWADEQATATAAHNCGERLYMSLNWRRGFVDGIADAAHVRVNNIARIHLTGARYDRIATIAMESPSGFGHLYTATYGPYLVAMNPSADVLENVSLSGWGGAGAFELVTRRPEATDSIVIPPGETRLLYRQAQ